MRVLVVHNYYQQRGGEDGVFESEMKLLSENGHDVEALIFHNDEIRSGIDKIKAGLAGIYNPYSVNRLKSVIIRFKPDVMHVHNFFPLASPWLFDAAKQAGVGTVLTLHNYRLICANGLLFREGRVCEECVPSSIPLGGIMHACYRNSYAQSAAVTATMAVHRIRGTWHQQVDQYIALTDFAKQKFVTSALHLPPNQISVKPNFLADPGESQQQREPFFLYVGRLVPEKGLNVLRAAWDEHSPPLKIVGTGPLEAEICRFAKEYSNVEYLGFQEKGAVMDLMARCQALVFPTLWYEGFPMTLLEALATGTPVLCSSIGGLPEIIEDNMQGLLFTPGDVNALRQQIERLSSDAALWQRFSRHARERYLNRYTAEVSYRQLVAIYEKARQISQTRL